MKEWIQNVYGDEDKLSYDSLRKAVRESWDAISSEQLGGLIDYMHDRCVAVQMANGMYTKY